ncbi:Septum formation protein Maf [Candidatus Magnetomorum sp. HK-1]|nr:Septum formation protein Maf [Candidatus Magnetomorum sp. HK-1]
MNNIILASESPRRKQLLEQAGVNFQIIPANIDESPFSLLAPEDAVTASSKAKANCISSKHPESWILAADTIVVINNKILGKPTSKTHAREMLTSLSGKTHQVLTGYTICCDSKKEAFHNVVTTDVRFKDLLADEIEWYIKTNEPYDKAGAYAIQGIGAFIVHSIKGSYTNVVGLPVCEVMDYFVRKKIINRKL